MARFYKVLMEELCDRIEEDFVRLAKKKMEVRIGGVCEERETKSDRQKMNSELDALVFVGLRWYVEPLKESARSKHIDYLVSRGMLSVRKLTTQPLSIARKMVIKSDSGAHSKIPMLLGLEDFYPRDEKEEEEEGKSLARHLAENDSDSDDICLRRCNFGWIWAGDARGLNGLNVPANYDLRNQGYVFWDKARLLMFDTFQSPRDWVEPRKFPFGYQENSERPGVETKLKDVPVDSNVLEEIFDEIHGQQGTEDDGGDFFAVNWRN